MTPRAQANRHGVAGADLRHDLVALLPQLRAFARFLARDIDAADELVQDTIARALGAAPPSGSLRAWSFAILRNRFYEVLRRRKRTEARFDSLPEADAEQAGAVAAEQESRLAGRDLRRALWRLPREQREALALVVLSGVSVAEAARICACREGTIKSRVSRARAALAEMTGRAPAG